MNLALVHYNFGSVGGVEFVMEAHVNLLTAHGHQVRVICGSGASSDPRVTIVPEARANAVSGSVEILSEQLRPLLDESDVVVAHNVLTMPFNAALTEALWKIASNDPQRRWIAWIHDVAVSSENPLLGRAAPNFEYVAVSEQRRFEFKNMTGSNADVIPNGIDPLPLLQLTENVEALAREHSILDQDLVFLVPARLLHRKNLELAVRVMAALKSKNVKASSIITGAPDLYHPASANYKDSLVSLARELGVEREIIFPVFPVTNPDLASLYSIADALFFPSKQEGFGIPLLEAALHRLPVFCSDLESMKEIAPVTATFFSWSADPAVIAALIMERPDPARTARKRVVRDFSWDTIYTRYLRPLLNSR